MQIALLGIQRAKDVVQGAHQALWARPEKVSIPLNLGCSQYVGIDALTLLGKKNA